MKLWAGTLGVLSLGLALGVVTGYIGASKGAILGIGSATADPWSLFVAPNQIQAGLREENRSLETVCWGEERPEECQRLGGAGHWRTWSVSSRLRDGSLVVDQSITEYDSEQAARIDGGRPISGQVDAGPDGDSRGVGHWSERRAKGRLVLAIEVSIFRQRDSGELTHWESPASTAGRAMGLLFDHVPPRSLITFPAGSG